MKPKLTNFLPQIRCTEETRIQFDKMCEDNRRTLSNMLQIISEDIAEEFKKTGIIPPIDRTKQ